MKVILVSAMLVLGVVAEDAETLIVDASEGRATKTIDLNNLANVDLNNIGIQTPVLPLLPDLANLGNLGNLNVNGDPYGQLLLAIGNLLGFFNNIPGLTDLLTQLQAAGIDGVPATILAGIVALSVGKASFLGFIVKGLQIANQVLAIIGISMFGTYLYETNGDITGFIRRSDPEDEDQYNYVSYEAHPVDTSYYTNSLEGARSFSGSPIVKRLGSLVDKAIQTYDQLNE